MTIKPKKKKTKVDGILHSVQFDKNGIPLYIFTDTGIYHVEFRKMKRDLATDQP